MCRRSAFRSTSKRQRSRPKPGTRSELSPRLALQTGTGSACSPWALPPGTPRDSERLGQKSRKKIERSSRTVNDICGCRYVPEADFLKCRGEAHVNELSLVRLLSHADQVLDRC